VFLRSPRYRLHSCEPEVLGNRDDHCHLVQEYHITRKGDILVVLVYVLRCLSFHTWSHRMGPSSCCLILEGTYVGSEGMFYRQISALVTGQLDYAYEVPGAFILAPETVSQFA
jgi:hypothetical protein